MSIASSEKRSPSEVDESVAGPGDDARPMNTHDIALLEALQAFLLPLIRTRTPGQMNDCQQHQGSLGLGDEAVKLVAALKGFITSVVGESKSPTQTTIIQVPLQGPSGSEDIKKPMVFDEWNRKYPADWPKPAHIVARPRMTFHEKVLHELFNSLPTRLLHFEPVDSQLQICLVEKGPIFTQLASVLEANQDHPDYCMRQFEQPEDAIKRLIKKYTGYAILSHTWLHDSSGEVTYSDWNKGIFDKTSAGYHKLVNFCRTAYDKHRLTIGWMDTVCINKESSAELDESIRSMYNWYQRASICIIHLAETDDIPDIHRDTWFTRGWTLQELLAPDAVKFYNKDWRSLVPNHANDKTGARVCQAVKAQIAKATSITDTELCYIHTAPLSRRLQLAASRNVTREEDSAYSLMGICQVSIGTAYGEGGERAFSRLLHEILNSTSLGVLDLFNWGGENSRGRSITGLLPRSIKNYELRFQSPRLRLDYYPIEPLTLTHLGIRITVPVVSGRYGDNNGFYNAHVGDLRATHLYAPHSALKNKTFYFNRNAQDASDAVQCKFAIINAGKWGESGIYIPRIFSAKFLVQGQRAIPKYSVEDTPDPIVFELKDIQNRFIGNTSNLGLSVEELSENGIELVTLYL